MKTEQEIIELILDAMKVHLNLMKVALNDNDREKAEWFKAGYHTLANLLTQINAKEIN